MIVVPKSCPFYRYKPEENKVTTCNGDVVFEDNASYGICRSCKKEVSLIMEM